MSRPKLQLRGFTLVEVLIAVGAVSLIAVGLAKIFSATGETVRAGRRLSNLNEYASLLERQIRDDVASMTREGVLVIAHREVTDNTGAPMEVKLTPDQSDAHDRQRRIDQLMFFASGRFTTLREPIHPSRIASGTAARIYYGHGLREDDPAADVEIDQFTSSTYEQSAFGEAGGPNEYAADWILLRHVTVLADPLATDQGALTIPTVTAGEIRDNDIQVSLQPAASSIFRMLALTAPAAAPGDNQLVRDGGADLPQFSSGIVDIATTDLNEMRQVILDAQVYPQTTGTLWNPAADDMVDGAGNLFAYQRDADPAQADVGNAAHVASNMKRWMIGALPTSWPSAIGAEPERRMRCEFAPPDALGIVSTGAPYPSDEPWRRSDHMMLAASNFVPHCTEFIVEWSFGNVDADTSSYRYGHLIWHGLPRHEVPGDTATPRVAGQYRPSFDPEEVFRQTITRLDGSVVARDVPQELVHFPPRVGNADPQPGRPFYSCFGYLDPTYPSPAEAAYPFPETIPWAWPKLLRITISLVDPADPLREQTFQFIVELPEGRQNRF